MKKYDVYGIGNALLDMEVAVEQEFLNENSIDKGIMTLIDEESQNQLVRLIHGENAKLQSGGSAANTVVAVSQFGGKSYYSCKVAHDDHGEHYLKDLKEAGVDTFYQLDTILDDANEAIFPA